MMPARIQSNEQALAEAACLQRQSKEVTLRMQQRLQETEDHGVTTLDDLYIQRMRLTGVEEQTNRMHDTLDETEAMQKKLGGLFSLDWLIPSHKIMRQLDRNIHTIGMVETEDPKERKSVASLNAFRGRRKDHGRAEIEPTPPQGLLDGKHMDRDYKDQLQALDNADKELDLHLENLGMQLERLAAIAEELGQETQQQHQKIGTIRDQMMEVNARQYEAIDRNKKFMGNINQQQRDNGAMPKLSMF